MEQITHMGEMRNCLMRPRHKWKDNTYRECGGVNWIVLYRYRVQWCAVMKTVLNLMFCKRPRMF